MQINRQGGQMTSEYPIVSWKLFYCGNHTLDDTLPDNNLLTNFYGNPKTYVTFNPEIFLFENPKKLYELIDSIREKIDNEFKAFDKFGDFITKLKDEKEITGILNAFSTKKEFKDIFNFIDSKYSNYTNKALMEMKLGVISIRIMNEVKSCTVDIKNEFEELKKKLYSTSNLKNKNLMMLNIEDELQKI